MQKKHSVARRNGLGKRSRTSSMYAFAVFDCNSPSCRRMCSLVISCRFCWISSRNCGQEAPKSAKRTCGSQPYTAFTPALLSTCDTPYCLKHQPQAPPLVAADDCVPAFRALECMPCVDITSSERGERAETRTVCRTASKAHA